MKLTLLSVMLTISVVTGTNASLSAQSKTIPGEATTITATVEAIDATTRTLTVKGPGGNFVPITVPKSVERFSEIKVGDTITARYYDNIVIRLKPAGEAAVDTTSESVTKGTGASPAGTAATQRTITATIVAIDNKVPSITFKGEKVNWTYSSRVADKASLAKVKVGDRVDITWTEALMVSVTSPAKKD
jgi:Cu/Ag efflux protein CusF